MAKRVLPQSVLDWLRQFKAARVGGDGPRFPERGPKVDHMVALETGLWVSRNPAYLEQLDRAIRRTGTRSRSRAYGSLAVARWEFHEGRLHEALTRLDGIHPADQELQAELDLFRADCFFALGDPQSALTLLSRLTGRFTTDQNLLLRVGQARALMGQTTDHGSGPVSEALNRIYNGAGHGLIRRTSVGKPVAIDNLSCDVRTAGSVASLPLVSVVVVVPDPVPMRHVGLSCLLDQSWENLEILVIGGPSVTGRLVEDDLAFLSEPRVRVIEDDAVTVASAMGHAAGELVTAHGYGSWAHPQRIETQASALLFDRSLKGVVAHHMFVDDELNPRPLAVVPRSDLVGPDPSSTMVRISETRREDAVATYEAVSAAYSPFTGLLSSLDDVTLVEMAVPLTLTLAAEDGVPR